ncbi:signal peptidase II [Actinomyces sp. 565]|nr:signal peptidase II [Actinomyces sp. 565]
MSDYTEPARPLRPGTATDPGAASAKSPGLATRRYTAFVWLLAAAVLVADQLTKVWAVAALSGGRRVHLLGDWLTLVLVRNPGAAFSFATGQTWIFGLIAIAVTVAVARMSRRLGSAWWAAALGLVLGGAVGNLIDRLVRSPGVLRGHVVDFIDYGGWFVGNIADIAIVVAAVVIMVLSLRGLELDGTRAGAGRGRHAEAEA